MKYDIQVTVVDDSTEEKCAAHCGMDWSSVEAISLVTERVKDRFGDRVQLGYLDLSNPATLHYTVELSLRIRDKNLSLPLLVIDGQPRISGQFDIRQVLDAIEAEVEIKS